MSVLEFNISWMVYNGFLAILAVIFGIFYLRSKWIFFKIFFGFLWLLFFPNTIYIFTDLEHLIYEWGSVSSLVHFNLLLQYIGLEIVGFITFLWAFFPFEYSIQRMRFSKKGKIKAVILFNFLIAFGMVLGRVERINSWYVFTQLGRVIHSSVHVFTSFNLLGLTMLFGILCNCVYFLFRKSLLRYAKNFL